MKSSYNRVIEIPLYKLISLAVTCVEMLGEECIDQKYLIRFNTGDLSGFEIGYPEDDWHMKCS